MPNIAKNYVNYLKILDVSIGSTKKIQKKIIMTVFYCILMIESVLWLVDQNVLILLNVHQLLQGQNLQLLQTQNLQLPQIQNLQQLKSQTQ